MDCLNYIRVLKSLGIAVIFEKENINTLESDSEMLITMMGAFAQAESESMSANIIDTFGVPGIGEEAFAMDISTIGSISKYTKTTALKSQWNLKKKSGDVTGHSKGFDDFLSVSSSFTRTQEDADNEKLQKITDKVNVGAKLTNEEMEYLKEKNPQLYEKLRQIEKEQKAYEDALRHCKSKDEAQRLHMARVGEAMQAAKNGDGTAAYRMNRMSESMTAFSETEEYKKLSTTAEQALERKEQRETEQSEAEVKALETEKTESEQPEKTDESAPTQDAKAADAEASAESIAKAVAPTKSYRTETDTEASMISTAPRFGTWRYPIFVTFTKAKRNTLTSISFRGDRSNLHGLHK